MMRVTDLVAVLSDICSINFCNKFDFLSVSRGCKNISICLLLLVIQLVICKIIMIITGIQ